MNSEDFPIQGGRAGGRASEPEPDEMHVACLQPLQERYFVQIRLSFHIHVQVWQSGSCRQAGQSWTQ